MTTKIIFAIDNGENLHTRSRFERHLDSARAMGRLNGEARCAIGKWTSPEGVVMIERAYMLDAADYKALVVPNKWTQHQDCVLVVRSNLDAAFGAADLSDVLTCRRFGQFVPAGHTMPDGDWTRFDDTGEFWRVV